MVGECDGCGKGISITVDRIKFMKNTDAVRCANCKCPVYVVDIRAAMRRSSTVKVEDTENKENVDR